jgi:uncharacterized protein
LRRSDVCASDIQESLRARLAQEHALILTLKVIPRAAANQFCGFLADGSLKVKIAAVAEKGKANDELCSFLARALAVPNDRVQIISGATSQRKRVKILGD